MTNDKLNQLNGNSVSTKELGKLTKLVNEIKLIEGFQPIKLTGNRAVFIDNKPAQLLEARTMDNKSFTMVSEQIRPALDKAKHIGLTVDSQQKQFILSFNEEKKPNEAQTRNLKNGSANLKNENIYLKNNNLNQSAIINKHYQTQASAISEPRTTHTLNEQNKNIEIPVRLASKIEYINVLAKLPSQEDPKSTHPRQNSALIDPQLMSQPQKLKTASQFNGNSHIKPEANHQGASNKSPTPSTNINNMPAQSLAIDTKSPQSGTETQQKQPIQSQNTATHQDKNQAYINKPSLTDKDPKQITKTFLGTPTAVQQEQSQLDTKSMQTLSGNQIISSQARGTQVSEPSNHKFKPSHGLINSHQEKADNRIIQGQALTSELISKPNQYKVSQSSQEFILESAKPLSLGEKIPVIRDENGKLQLIPNTQDIPSKTLDSNLAKSLPQQLTKAELSQLIQSFNQLQTNPETDKNTQRLIQQILTSIPQSQNLESPQELKQALSNSGLFFENKLFNSPDNLTHDLKANLLKLQTSLVQGQPESMSSHAYIKENLDQKTGLAISQAIERITSSQIRNLLENNKVEGLNLPLTIELPIRDKGETSVFQLQIDKDQTNNTTSPNKRRWLAKLLFDFPETGKFEARLNVEGNKLAVIFIAEEKETANRIHKQTKNLTKQLTNKGIEVTQVDSFCKPVEDKIKSKVKRNLIDVRT